jgi:hypothetical protein
MRVSLEGLRKAVEGRRRGWILDINRIVDARSLEGWRTSWEKLRFSVSASVGAGKGGGARQGL